MELKVGDKFRINGVEHPGNQYDTVIKSLGTYLGISMVEFIHTNIATRKALRWVLPEESFKSRLVTIMNPTPTWFDQLDEEPGKELLKETTNE